MINSIESDRKTRISENILIDSRLGILRKGNYRGSIVTKITDNANSIIFSDNIKITDGSEIIIEGLKVGVEKDKAVSVNGQFRFDSVYDIAYSYKLDKKIIDAFDKARFNATFPYMISFLNTKLLYHYSKEYPVDHRDFVIGEIINHPIGLLYNDSVILGDRIVVDSEGYPVFYDAFIVKKNILTGALNGGSSKYFEIPPIEADYEPIMRMNIHFIKYILILGVEMLK